MALSYSLLLLWGLSAGACREDSVPYNLANPNLVVTLSQAELTEISALSPTQEPGIYCALGDERGEIFFLRVEAGGAITRRVLFRDKGDFEGVEMVGKTLYALKSSGEVFEIQNWDKPDFTVRSFPTALTKEDDVEGLGYDAKRQALLLACKGNPELPADRKIYAFFLKTNTLSAEPVYTIRTKEAIPQNFYPEENKVKYFSPSGIAIHPITGEVYVISSVRKRLVVLDYKTGQLLQTVQLDKHLLPQPEGISFDPKGNLFLATEGKKGQGQILRFDYKPSR